MSLESSVATVLRDYPVSRVNFKIGNILINKAQMDKVAEAIINNSIEIKIGGSGPNFDAFYTSWKSLRQKPGEKKKIGEITVSQQAVKTVKGKGSIFHESVHALMDVSNYRPPPPTMLNDEVFAYIAGALYMVMLNTKIADKGKEGAIYSAAYAIIDSKQMLRKTGTILKWSDCDALLEAVKAIPVYNPH